MARVVQRRGTPPYLLILFVFLFLVSTVLAVLFYLRADERTTALAEREQDLTNLRSEKSRLSQDISLLVKDITGSPEMAVKAAREDVQQALGGKHAQEFADTGLASAVRGLDQKVSDLSARIDALKQVERDLKQTIAKNQAAAKQAQQSLEKQLAAAVAAKTQAEARHKAELAAKDKQRLNDLAAKDALIKEKEQRVAVLNQEKASLRDRLQEGQAEIHRLMRIIRELKKGPKVGELVLRQPDGKIAKVLLDEPVCYIDLGEKDHVTAGLSFSVYSRQSGIPEDGKPKAKIVVVNVGPTTSECHILESDRNDPILEGDLVANVVFHPQRTYKFVVEGEFDLYGTGRPDPLANRTVRALIESFGGKVSDVVSVDTDFVVMGEEPPRPPKPAEDAPPVVWQAYNERLKVYDRFKKVQAMAISLQIPVLNTSRFLAFSGYVPRKRLTEPE